MNFLSTWIIKVQWLTFISIWFPSGTPLFWSSSRFSSSWRCEKPCTSSQCQFWLDASAASRGDALAVTLIATPTSTLTPAHTLCLWGSVGVVLRIDHLQRVIYHNVTKSNIGFRLMIRLMFSLSWARHWTARDHVCLSKTPTFIHIHDTTTFVRLALLKSAALLIILPCQRMGVWPSLGPNRAP